MIIYGVLYAPDVDGETLLDMNGLLARVSPKSPPVSRTVLVGIVTETRVFVARDTEKTHMRGSPRIVGMALITGRRLMTGYKGYVDDVAVNELYGGRGIGRHLMEMLIAYARDMGMKHLELTSNPNNPERAAAIKLYESLGFKPHHSRLMRLRFEPVPSKP